MIDIYYRFPSKSDAENILAEFRDQEHGNWIVSGPTYALDVVGTLYKTVSSNDVDTSNPPILEEIAGYHVNLRIWGNDIARYLEIAPIYTISPPNNPQRVWA